MGLPGRSPADRSPTGDDPGILASHESRRFGKHRASAGCVLGDCSDLPRHGHGQFDELPQRARGAESTAAPGSHPVRLRGLVFLPGLPHRPRQQTLRRVFQPDLRAGTGPPLADPGSPKQPSPRFDAGGMAPARVPGLDGGGLHLAPHRPGPSPERPGRGSTGNGPGKAARLRSPFQGVSHPDRRADPARTR